MRSIKSGNWLNAIVISFVISCSALAASPDHVFIGVKAGSAVKENLSGRLLVFLKKGSGDKEVDTNPFQPTETWVAAKEVTSMRPGVTVWLDADELAFPKGFSALPAGKYEMQIVLDVDHNYNYVQRTTRDWVSEVVPFQWTPGSKMPQVTISRHFEDSPKHIADLEALRAKAKANANEIKEEHFISPSLSQFWGRQQAINAWVVLPPNYNEKENKTYPTVYWTHGFGGNMDRILGTGLKIRERMDDGRIPAMIWVMLDESIPQGTHEFTDSVNNGPWGKALTTEFIPYLENHYRMDAKVNGRFLNGHSSGGWATLQLQINYPTIFGGTWSTSPDSSDFHDFTGPDLYAAKTNMYYRADGTEYPLVRADGKVVATLQQFARLENVMGTYGGQFQSFDWVFSPRGDDGQPEKMFNRLTGEIDPKVVAYWHDHYDLANVVTSNWATRGDDLRGRIHLIVGDADTFYLDGAAHKLQAVLEGLHADAHFTYLPGRSHFDVYSVGEDKMGLMSQIAKEMYAVARP